MSALIERLRSNDPSLTKIELDDWPHIYYRNFGQFLAALRGNCTVEVFWLRRHFLRALSQDEFIPLLRAFGQMEALTDLRIYDFRIAGRVPMSIFCNSVGSAKKLNHLTIESAVLTDATNCQALQNHPTLKIFETSHLRYDYGADDDDDEEEEEEDQDDQQRTSFLDNFIQALTTCPKLEVVKLHFDMHAPTATSRVPWSPEAVASLSTLPSMRTLMVHTNRRQPQLVPSLVTSLQENPNNSLVFLDLSFCHLGDEDAVALVNGISTHSSVGNLRLLDNAITSDGCRQIVATLMNDQTVVELDLSHNDIGDEGAAAFANLLQSQAHPTLKHLLLDSTGMTDSGLILLADAIAHNPTLLSLDVASSSDATEAAYAAIVEALQENRVLTFISLLRLGGRATIASLEAILAMIRDNDVLRVLHFSSGPDPESLRLAENINLYTFLNRAGRRQYMQGETTRADRISVLVSAHEELDAIFYLVRARPDICQDLRGGFEHRAAGTK